MDILQKFKKSEFEKLQIQIIKNKALSPYKTKKVIFHKMGQKPYIKMKIAILKHNKKPIIKEIPLKELKFSDLLDFSIIGYELWSF